MNSPKQSDLVDVSEVEFVAIDYFGTQGKSWCIDEARTIQDLLGHRYNAPEGQEATNGVDPRLRRLLDTTNIKDQALFLHHVAGKLGTGPVTARALAAFAEMLERVRCCTGEFKDTPPALEGLKQMGYWLGVISNLSPFDAEHIFYNQDQFHRHFAVLVLSYEVGHVKPEPEMYLEGADRLKLPLRKILLVDDEVENVKAAVRLGMKGVLLDRLGKVKETIPGVPKIRLLTDLLELLPNRNQQKDRKAQDPEAARSAASGDSESGGPSLPTVA